jgi:hypothetical protein
MNPTTSRIGVWLATVWKTKARVDAVAYEYHRLKDFSHVLADIAVRGNIWRTSHDPAKPDALNTAFNEGRRALALEIIELAEMDPRRLREIIDAITPRGEPK